MEQALLVMTNLPDAETAKTIARSLVEQRVAACVNILPAVHSIYRWQGAVEEAQEVTLLIKTAAEMYDDLESSLKALHPYEVPELIAVPITTGLPDYLRWIVKETGKDMNV